LNSYSDNRQAAFHIWSAAFFPSGDACTQEVVDVDNTDRLSFIDDEEAGDLFFI